MAFLAHFLIGSLIFLELSYRSCLYIFEINSLSIASFAIIFSHSEGFAPTDFLTPLLHTVIPSRLPDHTSGVYIILEHLALF